MDKETFLLVLLASVLHATWNSLIRTFNSIELLLGMSVLSTLVGLSLLLVLPGLNSSSLLYLMLGGSFHVGSRFFVQIAYSKGDMSQIYPILRGAVPLITTLLALIAGEVIVSMQYLALFGVASGVAMLALRGGARPAVIERKAVAYAVLTAFCSAAYTVVDGLGARISGSSFTYTAWIYIIDGVFSIFVTFFFTRNYKLVIKSKTIAIGLLSGSCQLLSFGIAIYAMTKAPIALVSVTRETSLVFGLFISVVVLKEFLSWWRICGASLIISSLFLIQSLK